MYRNTSVSVLLIVGSKCTLASSHADPWWVTVSMPTGQRNRRTYARPLHYVFRLTFQLTGVGQLASHTALFIHSLRQEDSIKTHKYTNI